MFYIRPNTKSRQKAFTVAELAVVIAVVSVLAALSVVGYGSWRQRVATTETQSDLRQLAALMKNNSNFGGYPLAIPASFTSSGNVTVTYVSGSASTYCIESRSNTNNSIVYRMTHVDSEPKTGTCPVNVADQFNGSGVLAATESGGKQWQYINGSPSNWTRTGGRASYSGSLPRTTIAYISSDTVNNNILSMAANTGTYNISIAAIYFNIADANNWLRVKKIWYSSGNYSLFLEKMDNGTLRTISEASVGGYMNHRYTRVITQNNTVTVRYGSTSDTNSVAMSVNEPITTSNVGFGFSSDWSNEGFFIDDVSITPLL